MTVCSQGEILWLPIEGLGECYRRYRLPDAAAESAMVGSLARHGQISPVVVCQREERPEILDGFKRLSVARALPGVTALEARILDGDEPTAKVTILGLNGTGRRMKELEEAWIVHALVHPDLPTPPASRGSMLDGHLSFVRELLARWPEITSMRVHEELRGRGFAGGYTIVKDLVRRLRPPRSREPVVRFETGRGVQSQMDYAVYNIDFSEEGRRRVNLFSYVLGHSRRQYLRCPSGDATPADRPARRGTALLDPASRQAVRYGGGGLPYGQCGRDGGLPSELLLGPLAVPGTGLAAADHRSRADYLRPRSGGARPAPAPAAYRHGPAEPVAKTPAAGSSATEGAPAARSIILHNPHKPAAVQ